MRRINLDNHHVTKPNAQAIKAMEIYYSELWGVPSVPHGMGQELLAGMEAAYKAIYKFLGAQDEDHFVFTSCGAEAVNHVIFSTFKDISAITGKNHFVTSRIDESPSVMAIGQLDSLGAVSSMAQVNDGGFVTKDAIADAITPRTALVSLSWANALTGVIQPVEDIAAFCKERGILLHLDASHTLGKTHLDAKTAGADFITFDGQGIHAPLGTGGLWAEKDQDPSPLIAGGSMQSPLRGGHPNIPGLIAMGHCAQAAMENVDFINTETARLRNKLEEGIIGKVRGAYPCFANSARLPNCTSIVFPGIGNDALLYSLNKKGILASFGGNPSQTIANVLSASGMDPLHAQCAVSFSLSHENSEDEIDEALETIIATATNLQNLSEKVFH